MTDMPPVADAPQIEGKMFLFRKPELLTKEAHGDKGVARPDRPFAFCEAVRAVPITVSEIAMVPESECRTPTLMGHSASCANAGAARAVEAARAAASAIFVVM